MVQPCLRNRTRSSRSREEEVVLELLEGGRVATIAEQVSPRTVSNHLKSSFSKLGVHSQAELIELARSEPERRQDWRDWLELRARSDAQGDLVGDPQQRIEEWRDSNVDRVSRLQEAGLVRDDLDPRELLAALGALALGAGARLLGNASEASAEKELRMVDTFVDSLGTSGRT